MCPAFFLGAYSLSTAQVGLFALACEIAVNLNEKKSERGEKEERREIE